MSDIETQADRLEDNYAQCNILLIGKTGVGKSTFANYLFNKEIFTTGSGKPVTGWEDNFQHHQFQPFEGESNVRINVYDSVGLEPNNFEEWFGKLEGFLKDKSSMDKPNDQMHILLYVINGGGARIEQLGIDTLVRVCNDFDLPTLVVINQCDRADEAKLSGIENALNEAIKQLNDGIQHKITTHLSTIRACSVSTMKRDGKSSEQYGKDEAVERILDASIDKVGLSLRKKLYDQSNKIIEGICKYFIDQFNTMEMSILNAYRDKPEDFNNWFWKNIEVPNLRDSEPFAGPEFTDYHTFLNLLARQSRKMSSAAWDDFHSSFSEVEKIIDLNVRTTNPIDSVDLTLRSPALSEQFKYILRSMRDIPKGRKTKESLVIGENITVFARTFWDNFANFFDDIFQDSRAQKNRAIEKIEKRFNDIASQLKKACRI